MDLVSRGYFGPDSMMWKINRESILLVGGPAALLMQLAHPHVAAAVGDHSNFQANPFRRLRRTLDLTLSIVFGSKEEADRAAAVVNAVHSSVRGTAPGGRTYDARDPSLLLWVHSTLVDSSLKVYEACFGKLAADDLDRYYEESRLVAGLFRIPRSEIPASLTDLREQMEDRIASGEVAVGDQARELAKPILRPLRVVPARLATRSAFVTASLLPDPIRDGYGLKVGRSGRALLSLGGSASRAVVPRIPPVVRSFPVARRALSSPATDRV